MFTLALETSTSLGSVALLDDETCVAESRDCGIGSPRGASARGRRERHSADLIPAVQKILAKAKVRAEQVDLWVVGLGPGSFMGIRVGIAAAKGFALATGNPLVGVPSFDALAVEYLPRKPKNCAYLGVVGDAGRGEIYIAQYKDEPRATIRLTTAAQLPPAVYCVGAGMGDYPKAKFVALLGRKKFLAQKRGDDTFEPIYLRETKFVKVGVK